MQEATAIAAYPLSMAQVHQTFAASGDLYHTTFDALGPLRHFWHDQQAEARRYAEAEPLRLDS